MKVSDLKRVVDSLSDRLKSDREEGDDPEIIIYNTDAFPPNKINIKEIRFVESFYTDSVSPLHQIFIDVSIK